MLLKRRGERFVLSIKNKYIQNYVYNWLAKLVYFPIIASLSTDKQDIECNHLCLQCYYYIRISMWDINQDQIIIIVIIIIMLLALIIDISSTPFMYARVWLW